MKQLFFLLLLFIVIKSSIAQNVGIGTPSPNASALLDINSTNKGLLIPRMTTMQRFAINNPANGLMVYDTDKNGLYHFAGTIWRAILNSEYWSRPITSRSRIANATDSVGIGTVSPTEWLDVDGNIRSRNDLLADGRVVATGIVTGGGLNTQGGLTVSSSGLIGGNLTVNSNLSTNSDLIVNNATATLQLRNGSNVNKGFFQLSGDDVRFGTNSGNNLGNVIVRMNGSNRFTFTDEGRLTLSADNTPTINFNSGGFPKASLQVQGEDLTINAPGNKVRISNVVYVDDATNRVGIGIISPTERLHVSGDARITGDLSVEDTLFSPVIRTANAGLGRRVSFAGGTAYGDGSFASGNNCWATGDGTFVFADQTGPSVGDPLNITKSNHMFMRFSNGYRFITETGSGVELLRGDNSWSSLSDSTKKENFQYADGDIFLKKIAGMKLGSWNYKTQHKTKRHYGPMAQEFYTNFGNDGIGKIGNDTTIATADIDGVLMIAIQELVKEKEVLKNNYEKQSKEINRLKENEKKLLLRLEKMEAILFKMPVTTR